MVCFAVCRKCGPLPFPVNPALPLRRQPAELAGVLATSDCPKCGSMGLELREFPDADGVEIDRKLRKAESDYGRTLDLLKKLTDSEDETSLLEEIDEASRSLRERMGIRYDFIPSTSAPGIEFELIDAEKLEDAEPEPGVYLPVIRAEGWAVLGQPDICTGVLLRRDQEDILVEFTVNLDARTYWFVTSMTRDFAWLRKAVVARKLGLAFRNGIQVTRLDEPSARELNLVLLGWQMGAHG
ncbi:MAG TPA: hypothetical protein VMS77_03355 [Conexivisphaerales archaeon]|nr:hypothetical protein [Conexivisphaerales archaeon]